MGRRRSVRHGQERKLEQILAGLGQTTVGAGAQGRRIRKLILVIDPRPLPVER